MPRDGTTNTTKKENGEPQGLAAKRVGIRFTDLFS